MPDNMSVLESLLFRLERKYGAFGLIAFAVLVGFIAATVIIALLLFIYLCTQYYWPAVIPFGVVGYMVWSVREKKDG